MIVNVAGAHWLSHAGPGRRRGGDGQLWPQRSRISEIVLCMAEDRMFFDMDLPSNTIQKLRYIIKIGIAVWRRRHMESGCGGMGRMDLLEAGFRSQSAPSCRHFSRQRLVAQPRILDQRCNHICVSTKPVRSTACGDLHPSVINDVG